MKKFVWILMLAPLCVKAQLLEKEATVLLPDLQSLPEIKELSQRLAPADYEKAIDALKFPASTYSVVGGKSEVISKLQLNEAAPSLTLVLQSGKQVDIAFPKDVTLARALSASVENGTVETITYDQSAVKAAQNSRWRSILGMQPSGAELKYYSVSLKGCRLYVRLGDAVPDDVVDIPNAAGSLSNHKIRDSVLRHAGCDFTVN